MNRLYLRFGNTVGMVATTIALGLFAGANATKAEPRRVLLAASEGSPHTEATKSQTNVSWKRLPNPAGKTVENTSKTEFPNAIVREDLDDKLLRLCAVSVRCMLGLCFLDRARAYSFGVYLGSSAVERLCESGGTLESINSTPSTDSVGEGPFYPAARYSGRREGYVFQNGPSGLGYYRDLRSGVPNRIATPVLIRLVMLHDVDGEHIAHGFEKTLKSRILPLLKDSREPLNQLNQLNQVFNRLGRIPKGSHFDLLRSETGVLTLIYEGNALENFDSLLLGWACVDAFIGSKGHLSNQGKKELVDTAKAIYQVKPLSEFY